MRCMLSAALTAEQGWIALPAQMSMCAVSCALFNGGCSRSGHFHQFSFDRTSIASTRQCYRVCFRRRQGVGVCHKPEEACCIPVKYIFNRQKLFTSYSVPSLRVVVLKSSWSGPDLSSAFAFPFRARTVPNAVTNNEACAYDGGDVSVVGCVSHPRTETFRPRTKYDFFQADMLPRYCDHCLSTMVQLAPFLLFSVQESCVRNCAGCYCRLATK